MPAHLPPLLLPAQPQTRTDNHHHEYAVSLQHTGPVATAGCAAAAAAAAVVSCLTALTAQGAARMETPGAERMLTGTLCVSCLYVKQTSVYHQELGSQSNLWYVDSVLEKSRQTHPVYRDSK